MYIAQQLADGSYRVQTMDETLSATGKTREEAWANLCDQAIRERFMLLTQASRPATPRSVKWQDELLDRLLWNWKTTAGGVLSVAQIVFAAFITNGVGQKWTLVGAAITAGLTGLLAKDKQS